jgi:serine phosphatase RsbU (regulator of sigma subunit)
VSRQRKPDRLGDSRTGVVPRRRDTRALTTGAVALAVLAVVYFVFADPAARPLCVFVLPSLLTAALGGWRPTVLVGVASLVVAITFGVTGPLDRNALIARLLVIAAGVVIGAVGAAVRQHQSSRLADLDDAVTIKEAFERGLAPAPLPPAGFVAVARYRPAESRMHLGGDFLEAVGLSDGSLAVLIGDVCGHGPREAAIGAALRAGWKSIALGDERDPADWVDALDATFFHDGRIDTSVTLCTGYLDLRAGTARLVNAGHPPPVLLCRPTRMLDLPPAPPLGLGTTGGWSATELAWTGHPLLFYSDGLTDNPMIDGAPQRWGEAGLLDWLNRHASGSTVAELAPALLTAATAGRDLRDDVALLLVSAERSPGDVPLSTASLLTVPEARCPRPPTSTQT